MLVMTLWTGPEHRSKNLLLLGRYSVLAFMVCVPPSSSLLSNIQTLPPREVRSIVMSMSVCLSVSLSARITRKPHGRISPNFLCMLSVTVARSSSSGVAIRCLLPVLWMTSCFYKMGPVVRMWERA